MTRCTSCGSLIHEDHVVICEYCDVVIGCMTCNCHVEGKYGDYCSQACYDEYEGKFKDEDEDDD